MKKWLAKVLFKMALRLNDTVYLQAFSSPSIHVITCLESGHDITQSFGYKSGDDAKCINALTEMLGFNPLENLIELMDAGLVKDGAKKAVIEVGEENHVCVDGAEVWPNKTSLAG